MTAQEAKEILLLYRPWAADAEDPDVVAAIQVARQHPELARWFDNHCAFQNQMRFAARSIEVPPHLKAALLARNKIVPLPVPWFRQPAWIAAAAIFLVLLALSGVLLSQNRAPNRLANFQSRMVGMALRQYRMDIVTNDMAQLRNYLVKHGSPGDYQVTRGLERLELTGGGALRWRSHPVSMVCFNRGDKQMLYLFVLNRSALKDPPPQKPRVARVNDLLTASWTQGDKAYVLAGPDDPRFLEEYF